MDDVDDFDDVDDDDDDEDDDDGDDSNLGRSSSVWVPSSRSNFND